MGYNNTVAIISNTDYALEQIKSMLVLLRDVDRVECYNYYNAEDIIKNSTPSVVILYASENDKSCLKLLKRIRENKRTKNIPVILYPEYESTDFLIEAFDLGITDILSPPLKDYELVIRVIWAIQKSDNSNTNEIKNNFLKKIGVIDEETGFYKENYSLEYLETLISGIKENRQKACVMLVQQRSALKGEAEKNLLIEAMKKSVRVNDAIITKDENSYYIFLSKSKASGVYSVYDRIVSGLGPINSIVASAVEINDEDFNSIIELLDSEIQKTDISKIRVIKNGEVQSREIETKTEEIEAVSENENSKQDTEEENRESSKEEIIELGSSFMQEKIKEMNITPEKKNNNKTFLIKDAETDFQEAGQASAIVYKQAWAKKLNMIAEPLLKKYSMKFQAKYQGLDANLNIDPYISFLCFEKNDVKLNFQMVFDEPKTIRLTLSIFVMNSEIESETLEFEVTELDFEKLDIILKTITEEYENYISDI